MSGAHVAVEPRRVVGIGDEQPGVGVGEAVPDPVVAVEHRHREQDRAELPDAEEDRRGLGRRRQDDRDAVAARDAPRREHVGRLVREILQLAPVELADGAVEALPDHRPLVARVLVADVGGDVVALGHLPAVRGAQLVVARLGDAHARSSSERRIRALVGETLGKRLHHLPLDVPVLVEDATEVAPHQNQATERRRGRHGRGSPQSR